MKARKTLAETVGKYITAEDSLDPIVQSFDDLIGHLAHLRDEATQVAGVDLRRRRALAALLVRVAAALPAPPMSHAQRRELLVEGFKRDALMVQTLAAIEGRSVVEVAHERARARVLTTARTWPEVAQRMSKSLGALTDYYVSATPGRPRKGSTKGRAAHALGALLVALGIGASVDTLKSARRRARRRRAIER